MVNENNFDDFWYEHIDYINHAVDRIYFLFNSFGYYWLEGQPTRQGVESQIKRLLRGVYDKGGQHSTGRIEVEYYKEEGKPSIKFVM